MGERVCGRHEGVDSAFGGVWASGWGSRCCRCHGHDFCGLGAASTAAASADVAINEFGVMGPPSDAQAHVFWCRGVL